MRIKDLAEVAVSNVTVKKSAYHRELEGAFSVALRLIEAQSPGRQRSLAITHLEDAFMHAMLGGMGIDSPIRMR